MVILRYNMEKVGISWYGHYTVPGEVKISMIPYIENILKDFPEEIMGTVATPMGELFEVWEG